jgi:hypothetical protein
VQQSLNENNWLAIVAILEGRHLKLKEWQSVNKELWICHFRIKIIQILSVYRR